MASNMEQPEMDEEEAVAEALATPIGFAEGVLGMQLYPWQDEILTWYEDTSKRVKGTVVTPNGAGKSSGVVACLALWWVAVHPRGKVVITTKDGRQLAAQLWPALQKHRAKFDGWTWNTSPCIDVRTPTGGQIVAFTTDDAGRAEGWHREDPINGPLLIIVDEAKSVEEPIFEAFDRCTFSAILYVSSPGKMEGRFFESHTKLAYQYKRRVVTLAECPHIPKERIDDIIATYGDKHPFTRSTIYGEFMSEDGILLVFSHPLVTANFRSPPMYKRGDRSAFCDFAAGGDENVLALREGNKVQIVAAWREVDTMAACSRFIMEFRKLGLEAWEIWGDADGVGLPMCIRFWDLGWQINYFHGGSDPANSQYFHRIAECWHETALAVQRGEIILPVDDLLLSQLTARRVVIESDGRLGVEKKRDMKKRGCASPDRADAVVGAWCNRPLVAMAGSNVFDRWEEMQEPGYTGLGGMEAGL